MTTSNKNTYKRKFLFRLLYLIFLILYMSIFISILLKSEKVSASRYPNYSVCFTPSANHSRSCTDFIVQQIVDAKESIFVQAYGFSSKNIIHALINAKTRGVEIEIILDKSNFHKNKKYILDLLTRYKIEFYQDKVPGIAHNKIMIIDKKKVLTGSFNFTDAAEKRNSENIIVLTDFNIAEIYLKNWHARKMHALNKVSITKE